MINDEISRKGAHFCRFGFRAKGASKDSRYTAMAKSGLIGSDISLHNVLYLFGGLEHFLFSHILLVGGLDIFYFPIYWEQSSLFTNIFQRGSNHQPDWDNHPN